MGRATSGAGGGEEIAFTAYARQLCDDESFAAMRATLGALGQIKVGAITRNLTTSSGVVDATGFGFDPRLVLLLSATAANPTASWGVIDASNSKCLFRDDTSGMNYDSASAAIANPVGGAAQTAVGALITGFRLTWTKIGAPTDTLTALYVALGN